MSIIDLTLINPLSTRPYLVWYGCRAVSLKVDLNVTGLLEHSNMTKLSGHIIVLMIALGAWSSNTTGRPYLFLSYNN